MLYKILKSKYLLTESLTLPVQASSHGDTPLLNKIGPNNAKLTDLYAVTRDENLVLV